MPSAAPGRGCCGSHTRHCVIGFERLYASAWWMRFPARSRGEHAWKTTRMGCRPIRPNHCRQDARGSKAWSCDLGPRRGPAAQRAVSPRAAHVLHWHILAWRGRQPTPTPHSMSAPRGSRAQPSGWPSGPSASSPAPPSCRWTGWFRKLEDVVERRRRDPFIPLVKLALLSNSNLMPQNHCILASGNASGIPIA